MKTENLAVVFVDIVGFTPRTSAQYEMKNFFFRDERLSKGPTLQSFWGAPQDEEERSMVVLPRKKRTVLPVVDSPAA